MSQILLFRWLTADQTECEWLIKGARPERGTPAELAAHAAGHRLVLVVPGEAVTLTQARVASRQRSTLLKAIPYALEDSLAEDVEDLHFAVGPVVAGGSVPVAIVRHELLQGWLTACAEVGITPSMVVPAPLLLPYQDDNWSALVENDQALVRNGPWAGFATDLENLDLLLNLALSEAAEQRPQALQVWGTASLELTDPDIDVRYQDTPYHPLEIFAGGYRDHTLINLLQGPYSRRAHLGRWLRPWRAAAALVGIWLSLQLAFQVAEYHQLSRERQLLQTRMEELYKEAVPSARKIINPRVQLEHWLREQRQGTGTQEAGFLDLLYQGGQVMIAFNEVALRGLRYKENQLDIDLAGGSLETLDRLKQRLTEWPGLEVQMRTTKREDRVESQVTLRKIPS